MRRSLAMAPSLSGDQAKLLIEELEQARRLLAHDAARHRCESCGRPDVGPPVLL